MTIPVIQLIMNDLYETKITRTSVEDFVGAVIPSPEGEIGVIVEVLESSHDSDLLFKARQLDNQYFTSKFSKVGTSTKFYQS